MKLMTAAFFVCAAMAFPVVAKESLAETIAEPMSPRNIQVLLEKDASEVLLEVKGPYYIFNPHTGSRIASGLLGKRFMIRELESGLKWGEEFPGIHQIYIKPRSEETAIFINGIQYGGAVAVYGVAGTVNIVNDLDIEDYVRAILSTQNGSLEPEALSALAILTRTDAYFHSTRSDQSFWHVAGAEVGYQGCALVAPDSPVEKAITSTKHLILVHPAAGKNLPFAATWTEHSAGKTVSYQALFRKEGLSPDAGVVAPHAALARQDSKWHYTISKKQLASLLDLQNIQSMELFVDQPSGKVYAARIKSQDGSEDFDFFTLQNAIGKKHLLSSDFTVNMKDDQVLFSGFGRGHGAGLCLYSANALAQNGEHAVKILNKFFPETYLINLNALPEAK